MTVLNLHKKECLEIAKRILDWNFINPILVKTNPCSHMDTLMIIDGKKLAEKLELEIKSSLERSDLSNSYLVEFDFDNPNLQSDSLFFEKIIESAVFYEVPESISETKEDLNWFKKVIYENGYSKEELRKKFGIVEVNPKLNLEFLDLTIASPIEVETVFQRRTTEVEVGRITQYILPHERVFEPSVEISKHYITKQFERKHQVQILSTKTITTKKMLSNGYPANNLISKVFLELILKEIENTIEYQTMAGLTEEQYDFVNWAMQITKTVDECIRQFDNLCYTKEELKDMTDISSNMVDKVEYVYLIEFYGRDQGYSNRLVKAERLKKILADGSLLGQKEEIELKQTSKGLEVKDTDIERLERSYQGLVINAVPLEY
ncbi:hypothetical protein [Streptococcus oralis]|uniref:hypothetical protein n=1 Tax=Streptococcus oralis TaxID=1303 RepID=UPI0022848966|nr:hypothetical protein [Streptococcus oralis]MCY7081096.1 hypothetical protein [Streptococcus oralis]